MPPIPVLKKGFATAIVVGTILTVINQWDALFGEAPFRWLPFGLTYVVPFAVFLFSYYSNRKV